MRKTALSILAAAVVSGSLLALPSCANEDKYLEIVTSAESSYLIPASTLSCKGYLAAKLGTTTQVTDDITSKYFTVRGLKFRWNHAYNSLTIALIRLRFNAEGLNGQYTCDISGDELSALSTAAAVPYTPWTASIPSTGDYNTKTEVQMNCDLRCGGITTKEISFKAPGRIQVIGFMSEPNGNQIPVNVSTPFSIENLN